MADGTTSKAAEPQELQKDADRRDSERIPIALLVRDAALGGSFEEHAGNVGIGGVFFAGLHPPVGNRVELRFLLPGQRDEIQARGEVLRISREGERFGTHVRFLDMPIEAELVIARFLQKD